MLRSMSVIESVQDFQNLSVRDLLDARAQYHWHLVNRANVVGTAIGLYLIRDVDPWPKHVGDPVRDIPHAKPRRLDNSGVRPYSWPCVLAFVRQWEDPEDLGRNLLPRTLYLPDGRAVPVCVVEVMPTAPAPPDPGRAARRPSPDSFAGAGLGLVVRTQGLTREATAGCLVSDGHTRYVLTNRHVSGDAGEPVFVRTRHGLVEIGTTSRHHLGRRRWRDLYPNLAGDQTYVNLDTGLVTLNDASDWTSAFYGIGEVGELADLNEGNVGLQLIDRPVVAHGAVGGFLRGSVKALFYRYQSLGGWDYVSDLLIAPEQGGPCTEPGDSGTVWHLEVARDGRTTRHPLAVEWGGQTFADGETSRNFSLATNLSGICRLLDVEIVNEASTGVRPYWGDTGHYTVGSLAIGQVADAKLRAFLDVNADVVSFDRGVLQPGDLDAHQKALADGDVVPLADVPDLVWKKLPKGPHGVPGGRDHPGPPPRFTPTGPEHPTHYADVDRPGPDGKTLLELCVKDPKKVEVAFWQKFYDDTGQTTQHQRGCLPFRVWQFFDAMVSFAQQGDAVAYLSAAGLLAHYVGDACQPLHGSLYADGDPSTLVDGEPRGKGVHSAYETDMVDRHIGDLYNYVEDALGRRAAKLKPVGSGHDAAVAIVALMDRTAKTIRPIDLVDAYVGLGGGSSRHTLDGLWAQFADATAKVMADGVRVLAHLWQEAWRAGGGAAIPAAKLKAVKAADVVALYRDKGFVPSLDLDQIGTVLKA
jgi:hypothetical protein